MKRKEKNITVHTLTRKPDALLTEQIAVGPCPYCGRIDHCLNNVPLTAYCWGTEEKPHPEWSKIVPKPYNVYLPEYDKHAKLDPPEGIADMTKKELNYETYQIRLQKKQADKQSAPSG